MVERKWPEKELNTTILQRGFYKTTLRSRPAMLKAAKNFLNGLNSVIRKGLKLQAASHKQQATS